MSMSKKEDPFVHLKPVVSVIRHILKHATPVSLQKEAYKEEIKELRQHLDQEALVEKALQKVKEKRKGVKVFCVGCGAQKRTLRKWYNSYLCTDCYKIMMNVGKDKYIKALRGEET